jgi:DNA (cytosine-5)-methyltransferase 1
LSDTRRRKRRLTPDELELLNGFPRGWTATGMTPIQRAFCMGNALVVGLVRLIAQEIARDAGLQSETAQTPIQKERRPPRSAQVELALEL